MTELKNYRDDLRAIVANNIGIEGPLPQPPQLSFLAKTKQAALFKPFKG
jgi:hypothetical protein